MKTITLLLSITLLQCFTVRAQADKNLGVHLEGMYSGQVLSTDYADSTGVHTLYTAPAPMAEPTPTVNTYVDKVLLYKFLHLEGDSTVVDAVGNYSDAGLGKTAFIIKPKPGEIIMIARMIISYTDDGAFDSGSYGNNITLTNGITSYFRQNGIDVYQGLDPNIPIMKNPGWAALCYDSRIDDYGQGEVQLSARFTFTTTGKYIRLNGDTGDEYVLYFHDDFTGLNRQSFLMQGYYEVGPVQ